MPSNSTGTAMRALALRFKGLLGHLIGPEAKAWRRPWLPYALDNGAHGCWQKGVPWDETPYFGLCEKAAAHETAPLWILVPDVVCDRGATLRSWEKWAPVLRRYGWPLAFALQDGMTVADVPREADVLFMGGSVEWKRQQLRGLVWKGVWPRLHVGKINGYGWLWLCVANKAESCDGTGWFRGDQVQLAGLVRFLEEQQGGATERPLGSLSI